MLYWGLSEVYTLNILYYVTVKYNYKTLLNLFQKQAAYPKDRPLKLWKYLISIYYKYALSAKGYHYVWSICILTIFILTL